MSTRAKQSQGRQLKRMLSIHQLHLSGGINPTIHDCSARIKFNLAVLVPHSENKVSPNRKCKCSSDNNEFLPDRVWWSQQGSHDDSLVYDCCRTFGFQEGRSTQYRQGINFGWLNHIDFGTIPTSVCTETLSALRWMFYRKESFQEFLAQRQRDPQEALNLMWT